MEVCNAMICIMYMSNIEGSVKPIPNLHFYMLFNEFEMSIGTGNKHYYINCCLEGSVSF